MIPVTSTTGSAAKAAAGGWGDDANAWNCGRRIRNPFRMTIASRQIEDVAGVLAAAAAGPGAGVVVHHVLMPVHDPEVGSPLRVESDAAWHQLRPSKDQTPNRWPAAVYTKTLV